MKEQNFLVSITGATGFVGRHLVDRLIKNGFATRALIRDLGKETAAKEKVEGDLETGSGLEEFVAGIDVVVNLAGRFQPPFKDQLIGNAVTLENLCAAAVKSRVRKIIHISAAAVYGLPKDNTPFTEKDIPMPDTLYALAKKAGENVADFYHRNFGLSFVILRPPNVYGPGSDHGVVYNFIKSAKETGRVTIHGDGTQKRDFLFVGDLVDAVVKSLDYESGYEIFNISTDEPKDLNELTATLGEVIGTEIKIKHHGEAQGAKVVTASFDKAKKLLFWEPKTSLKGGLKQTLEAF